MKEFFKAWFVISIVLGSAIAGIAAVMWLVGTAMRNYGEWVLLPIGFFGLTAVIAMIGSSDDGSAW